MQLPTNHIALYVTISPYSLDHSEFKLRHAYHSHCDSTLILLDNPYSFFSTRFVLLPHLSDAKRYSQSHYGTTSFAGYYAVACCT